jgi:hypothetical protein
VSKRGQERRKSITHHQVKETRSAAQGILSKRQYADTLLVERSTLTDLIRCAELLDQLITAQDRRKA